MMEKSVFFSCFSRVPKCPSTSPSRNDGLLFLPHPYIKVSLLFMAFFLLPLNISLWAFLIVYRLS